MLVATLLSLQTFSFLVTAIRVDVYDLDILTVASTSGVYTQLSFPSQFLGTPQYTA